MTHRCLHLHTGQPEPWVVQVIQAQRVAGNADIVEIDLSGREVDYEEVLEQIFLSHSISVW